MSFNVSGARRLAGALRRPGIPPLLLAILSGGCNQDEFAPKVDGLHQPPADAEWSESVERRLRDEPFQLRLGDNSALRFDNPVHGLSLEIRPDGTTQIGSLPEARAPLAPRSRASVELETVAWGRTDSLRTPAWAAGTIGACADEFRVDTNGDCLRRAERLGVGLLEWWVNGPDGFEQGWTVTETPSGDGPLWVEIDVRGARVEQGDGEALLWTAPDAWFAYGHAAAWDETGAALPAWIEADAGLLRVVVDDREAVGVIHIDPLLSSPAWALEGNLVGLGFGSTVASAGDINGDGYGDVLVGAPAWDNGQVDEGRAYLFLGSATGMATSAAWTAESNSTSSSFGSSVASAGDVNGDGYGDVVVGAPSLSNGQTSEGAAFLYFGADFGLWPSANWRVESNQASASYGQAVRSAGDVNADGYADLLVTALLWDGTHSDAGAAFVYLGTATGPATTPSWTATPAQSLTYFGLAGGTAGDVNGDGYGDVIVGARLYDNGTDNEGAAFIYHGSSSGLVTTASGTLEINSNSAYFGANVAEAGDVNGDGYGDVLAFAFRYDLAPSLVGSAYLYLGSASGVVTTAAWSQTGTTSQQYLGSTMGTAGDVNGDGFADFVMGSALSDNGQADEGQLGLYLGSVTGPSTVPAWTVESNQAGANLGSGYPGAGDVNGDGIGDVLVSAAGWDNGQVDEGRVQIFYGSAALPTTTATWSVEGNQTDARMGSALASAGDVNGDGYADVLVGANYYDNGDPNEGQARLYLGAAAGLSGTPSWVREGNVTNSYFGSRGALTGVGDVNADGYGDIVVGSFLYDVEFAEGTAQLFLGSASGLGTTVAWTTDGDQAYAYWGSEVARAGDVNGDGFDDVLIGASLYDNGQADEGRAALFLGSATGLPTTVAWVAESNVTSANYGESLAAADFNADGYSDIVVGGANYNNASGAMWIYTGAAGGLSSTPAAFVVGAQASAGFATTLAAAGDVDGDGYADLAVGAPGYDNGDPNEGQVQVFLGSSAGLGSVAAWTLDGNAAGFGLGVSVASAGDMDGDGDGDILVGSGSGYGQAAVYLGSPSGLATTASWTVVGDQQYKSFGALVAGLGDVTGDGHPEVGVTAETYANPSPGEGAVWIYTGNTGDGTGLHPRPAIPVARASSGSPPISYGLRSGRAGQFAATVAFARSPLGRQGVRLAVEAKPLGTPFDGTGLFRSGYASSGIGGLAISQSITGLIESEGYHWRGRVEYSPVDGGVQLTSPWLRGGRSGEGAGNHLVPTDNDADNDGYPIPNDCDDYQASVHPGATEICDGFNTDCSGGLPTDELDDDNDQYIPCTSWTGGSGATNAQGETILGGSDCLDIAVTSNAYSDDVRPGVTELCDGYDTNCVGGLPAAEDDDDNDRYAACSGWIATSTAENSAGEFIAAGDDCLDVTPSANAYSDDVNPGAAEACDGYNTDCLGTLATNEQDDDNDQYVECALFVTATTATNSASEPLLGGTDCLDVPVSSNAYSDDVSPGAPTEACDGLDTNCQGGVPSAEQDDDNDQYIFCSSFVVGTTAQNSQNEALLGGLDCTDTLLAVNAYSDDLNPGASESCDGFDTNCSGGIPADELDEDNDRYVECGPLVPGSNAINSELETYLGGLDCVDVAIAINASSDDLNPGASEVCDGFDSNCTGGTPTNEVDDDNDRYLECSPWVASTATNSEGETFLGGLDCLDVALATNGSSDDLNPGATELCDGYDTNCTGGVPADELDDDNDQYLECASFVVGSTATNSQAETLLGGADCLDVAVATNAYSDDVRPGATEVCDGFDTNCTGGTPTDEVDDDNDRYLECSPLVTGTTATNSEAETLLGGLDCLDTAVATNASSDEVNPGASETCDGFDTNCTGGIPANEVDDDNDRYLECSPFVSGTTATNSEAETLLGGLDCLDVAVVGNASSDDVNPGASELCDGFDTNCTGGVPADEVDDDGDQYIECASFVVGTTAVNSQAEVLLGGVDCLDVAVATNAYSDDVRPGATEACDGYNTDCTGGVPADEVDDDVDQYIECASFVVGTTAVNSQAEVLLGGSDCLDVAIASNASSDDLNPGAAELCDGFDTNCTGGVPTNEVDDDADQYVECSSFVTTTATNSQAELLLGGLDCLDLTLAANAYSDDVRPSAPTEACDGYDTNCNGALGIGTGGQADELDTDGDGFFACSPYAVGGEPSSAGGDCADSVASRYPGAQEVCNGLDDDCDSSIADEGIDGDGDGTTSCTDCDDADANVEPGAPEICDGKDDDCVGGPGDGGSGSPDEDDDDGDQYLACTLSPSANEPASILGGGDCADEQSFSRPGGTEACDGWDNDCNSLTAPSTGGEGDPDRDQYVTCTSFVARAAVNGDGETILEGADCLDVVLVSNNYSDDVRPGAAEVCDGFDTDCVGGVVSSEVDEDNDQYIECAAFVSGSTAANSASETLLGGADCLDTPLATNSYSGSVRPGTLELCDGYNTDCSPSASSSPDLINEQDPDNDRYLSCAAFVATTTATNSLALSLQGGADCDDTVLAVHPNATEIVGDNIDENCDTDEICYVDADNDDYRLSTTVTSGNTTCADSGEALATDTTGECNDTDPAIHPGAVEGVGDGVDQNCDSGETCFVDNDDDGVRLTSTIASVDPDCTDPGEGAVGDPTGDCNDAVAAILPGATELAGDSVDQNCDGTELCYVDADNDSYRLGATASSADTDCQDSGEAVTGDPQGDCADGDPAIHPGAIEGPGDEIDQDCTLGEICYEDSDDDGYRLATVVSSVDNDCDDLGEAITADTLGDCDDDQGAIHPGALDSCDTIDQDCDGDLVEAFTNHDGDALPDCADTDDDDDLDPDLTDCGDLDSSIYAGAPELEDDGIDQDCSGTDTVTCFVDGDLDTWGDAATLLAADGDCADPGETDVGGDCDDDASTTYPGAPELCDAVDSDCDLTLTDNVPDTDSDTDPDCIDEDDDEDGFADSADCGPLDAYVYPGAPESCDGTDSDCDGSIVDGDLDTDGDDVPDCVDYDLDGDGWPLATDCDDDDPSIYPTAVDIADDGVDQDCSGSDTATCAVDGDGDGVGGAVTAEDEDGNCADDPGQALTSEDCDDNEATVYPGAPELADDSIDQDCSSTDTVTCLVDADGDLFGGTSTLLADDGDCVDLGESVLGGDCQDDNPAVLPGAFETCDAEDTNCDGSVVDGFDDTDLDLDPDCTDPDDDGDLDPDGTDCGPLVPEIFGGAAEICDLIDSDCDGSLLDGEPDFDSDLVPDCVDGDADGDGYDLPADCDAMDASIYPGAVEDCDAVDSNCDGSLVDGFDDTDVDAEPDCVDNDDDGDADPDSSDCAVLDATIHAGAVEFCDAVDGDCDGSVVDEDLDTDLDAEPDCIDLDDDGDGSDDLADCAPLDPAIAPGTLETADDGVDQDCNGTDTVSCFVDGDGDGVGGATTTLDDDGDCLDAGQAAIPGDCDDGDLAVYPGATEICNGDVDDDCDPTTDEQVDGDGDGTSGCAGDCDDDDNSVHPGATEACDGEDGDCSGAPDADEVDADADGSMVCDGDCDDNDADSHPDAAELCDGVDNDCDGVEDDEETDFDFVDWWNDSDGDGFGDPSAPHPDNPQCGTPTGFVQDDTDCDDNLDTVHPGAEEHCNGLDDNCDAAPDLGGTDIDTDNDGLLSCEGAAGVEGGLADCDDNDAAIFPGAEESCGDGIDQDCDGFEDAVMDDPECWEGACTGSVVGGSSSGAGGLFGAGLALVLLGSFRRRSKPLRAALLARLATCVLVGASASARAAEASPAPNVEALRAEVTRALGAASCGEARAAALQWTQGQPNDAAGWRALGDAARCSANHREAIVAYRRAAATGGNSPGLRDLIQLVSANLGTATVQLTLSQPVTAVVGRMLVGEEAIGPLSRDGDVLTFGDLPVNQPLTLVVEGKGLSMVKQGIAPVSPGENRTLAVQAHWVGLGTLAVGAYDKSTSKVVVHSGGVDLAAEAGTDVEVTAGTVLLVVENAFGRTETKVEVKAGTRVSVEPGRFAPSAIRLVGVPAGSQVRVVIESIGEDIVEVVRDLPAGEGSIDPETGLRLAPPQEFRPVPGGNGGVFVSHPLLGNGATTLVLLAGTENTAKFPVATLPGLARVEAAYKEWRGRTAAGNLGKVRTPVFAIVGGGLAGVSAVMFGAVVAADGRIGAAKAEAMGAPPGPQGGEVVTAAWARHVGATQERTGLTVVGAVLAGVSAVAFGVTFGTVGAAKRAVSAVGPWDPSSVK